MRCGVYVRVSTDDQRDNGYSIDSQLRVIKEYCEEHDIKIELILELYDVFTANGEMIFGMNLVFGQRERKEIGARTKRAMEENKLTIQNELTNEDIKNLIYTIRGKQVMLDSDVARLFEYATKDLNRNVKNNIERFPEYYCFQLTDEEYKSLRCKIFTLNENGRGQHRTYLPYVFTEYGITMLAGLLKCQVAVNVSIKIVNSFIEKIINS